MPIHELKTWPKYFEAVWNGSKAFEIRKDDRAYAVADTLFLREYDPEKKDHACTYGCDEPGSDPCPMLGMYTGRELTTRVDYILRGGTFGLERGNVIMSITLLQRATSSTRLPKVTGPC